MPPLETLPPPEIRVVEYFTSRLFCPQRKHLAHEYFLTVCFSQGGVVSASPNPPSWRFMQTVQTLKQTACKNIKFLIRGTIIVAV